MQMSHLNAFANVNELGRLSAPRGKFSIFYALELSRSYQLINAQISEKKFRYLMQTESKQRELAHELMGNLRMGGNAKTYGVVHLGAVQEYWDKEHSEMFRIVSFDMKNGLKPVFKGPNICRYEVCLIFEKGHWDGMKSVTKFFNVRNFCTTCEATYDRPERHRMGCMERCKKCCRMGFGFPCKDQGAKYFCSDCNRNFYNEDCFIAHTKSVCKILHKCGKCSETYQTRFKHSCGRYDSHFVLKELTNKGIKTELLMADLKIYQIKAGKVYFRDFWMLSQNRLAELPKTLELEIPAKLYFPHKYNKNENFGVRRDILPPFEDYCPGTMKDADYEKFEKWYRENQETKFELEEQLKVYCQNDVEILMAAVLKFRKLFLDITKDMDVIKDSVTIAGVVMKIFRAKFLRESHIPIVPEGGFEKADNQSKIAIKYFEWLAFRDGVKVRHACNGGEIEFGGYKVDCVIGEQKKIIEFQGCAFHGHPNCYKPWTIGPNGKSMEENYRRTNIRMEHLRDICKNFVVEEIWECDVKAELKKNKGMKNFFDNVVDKGPINPRDAYSGGRTMPFCLFAEASENVEIAMFDIISLYPFVNYDTPYPIGIPKIIKSRNYNVLWTLPDEVLYDGLLKVKVIPPKNLLYPLLSAHIDDMLIFPNCGVCARRAKKEFVMAKDVKKCDHRPERRALVGTFTSIELKKALELGYRVIGFYRAYHFEHFDTQLFKNYVRTKIRGMTLDRNNQLTYEDFKDMVLNYQEGKKVPFEYPDKFGPKRDGKVVSHPVTKNYAPIQKKGIIDSDFNVLPFGYY